MWRRNSLRHMHEDASRYHHRNDKTTTAAAAQTTYNLRIFPNPNFDTYIHIRFFILHNFHRHQFTIGWIISIWYRYNCRLIILEGGYFSITTIDGCRESSSSIIRRWDESGCGSDEVQVDGLKFQEAWADEGWEEGRCGCMMSRVCFGRG